MVAAEVTAAALDTMVIAADIPPSVTMAVATMLDTADMAGMADIGAIHTTATDTEGDGDGVLGLGGHIGVGDTRMATATALGITLPTLTITRSIALRATHVLLAGTTTHRHRVLVQNPGATTPGSLRDRRRALPTRTPRLAVSPRLRALRFSQPTGSPPRRPITESYLSRRSKIRSFVLKCRVQCEPCARCHRLHGRGKSRPADTATFRPRSGTF